MLGEQEIMVFFGDNEHNLSQKLGMFINCIMFV